jgi:hypothetical protein
MKSTLLMALLIVAAGLSFPTDSHAQNRIASRLVADRCMDVSGGSQAAGTRIVTWSCHGRANQLFSHQSNGEIRVYGMCVDALGGGGRDGDPIGIWPCNGGANQRWQMTGAGELRGINGKCIDIPGGNTAAGVGLVLWSCNNGLNQRWSIVSGSAGRPSKLYVIDGTDSREVHHNALYHVYERWSGPKAWQNGVNLLATNIDPAYSQMYSMVCNDARSGSVGDIFLLGYSRGAMMMVRLANEVRQNCNAKISFLGLVDAVNTNIWNWPTQVNSGIPHALHIRKTRWNEGVLTTRDIEGVRKVNHPQDINHQQIVCNKDNNDSAWRWTVDQLIAAAQQAGGKFDPSRRNSTSC